MFLDSYCQSIFMEIKLQNNMHKLLKDKQLQNTL